MNRRPAAGWSLAAPAAFFAAGFVWAIDAIVATPNAITWRDAVAMSCALSGWIAMLVSEKRP